MSACIADTICITQITLKEIYNVLLVDNWRFRFLSFKLIFDLLIVFLILFTSYLYFIFAFRYFYRSCVNTCFLLFIPLFQKLYIRGIVLSMNLNLKMTVERSKRLSYFLSLVFITKYFLILYILTKNERNLQIFCTQLFLRSVARICQATISYSFLRYIKYINHLLKFCK